MLTTPVQTIYKVKEHKRGNSRGHARQIARKVIRVGHAVARRYEGNPTPERLAVVASNAHLDELNLSIGTGIKFIDPVFVKTHGSAPSSRMETD